MIKKVKQYFRETRDYLGKFETINKDFVVIKEKYNLKELSHINPSKNKKSYKDYYTPELVEMVYKRYKNDVKKFDYQKEYRDLQKYVSNLNADSLPQNIQKGTI